MEYSCSDSDKDSIEGEDSPGSEEGIPDIDRLLINPYRWILCLLYSIISRILISSDDPIYSEDECGSEDSFRTAIDEIPEQSVSPAQTTCDCRKCPESTDISCCQQFRKIKQDCQGKEIHLCYW